ncbi:putative ribonuclease H-like domain-containing protein [Tanacetum coccineum]
MFGVTFFKKKKKDGRQTIKKKGDWESFISAWILLQDSPTWMSYLENYEQLQSVLEKYPRELQCEDELHIFNENFNKQSKAGKRSFLRKLGCISNPSALLVKEPAVKKNTRGRPSLKKQQKRKCVDPEIQDPSKSSYSTKRFWIDLNKDPPRHSSCSNYETCARDVLLDLNKEPLRHSSYVSRSSGKHGSHTVTRVPERFLKQLPQIFHPYVTELQDVIGDGNCGFRSVAVALGLPQDQWPRIRSDLVSELDCNRQKYKYIFGTTGYKKIYETVKKAGKWMEMPNTGLVIASTYKRVVISLSHGGNVGGCTTSFPLWSSPPQSESLETIVIAHVNGNHFIRATLLESCPLPLTHPLWITYKSENASGWEDTYLSRQNVFREYYYRIPETIDLTK